MFFGSGSDRGHSPVEWGEISYISASIHCFFSPSVIPSFCSSVPLPRFHGSIQRRTGRGVRGVRLTPLASDSKLRRTVNLRRKRKGKRGKKREKEKRQNEKKGEKIQVFQDRKNILPSDVIFTYRILIKTSYVYILSFVCKFTLF